MLSYMSYIYVIVAEMFRLWFTNPVSFYDIFEFFKFNSPDFEDLFSKFQADLENTKTNSCNKFWVKLLRSRASGIRDKSWRFKPVNFRGAKKNDSIWSHSKKTSWVVFHQPHWKICLSKLGSSSPSFGVKIPKICEVSTPRRSLPSSKLI